MAHETKARRPSVFINIPYVKAYELYELAIWVVLHAHDMDPKILKDIGPAHARLVHLVNRIRDCDYGISDFSMSRGNIILEHGLMLSEVQFGHRTDRLRVVGMIDDARRIPIELSDLQGYDFIVHGWDTGCLIQELTKWIRTNCREAKPVKSIERLVDLFEDLSLKYRSRYGYARTSSFYETHGPSFRDKYRRLLG